MRRVLAVLISVLTAVWPLLLPQPVSANPCGVTTAEYVSVKASGSKVDQSGGFYLDQSGDAGYGGSGGTGAATSGAGGAGGGGGQGGNPYVKNSPYGGDALTVNIPVNVAVQDSD
ncbi:MAG TPA: hypothetical protein VFU40_04890, partial [Gemmatimonadales bacterium]|nr:hypothetical protein [Gemmatimonadales bacterium]